jgi:hypothetical protein
MSNKTALEIKEELEAKRKEVRDTYADWEKAEKKIKTDVNVRSGTIKINILDEVKEANARRKEQIQRAEDKYEATCKKSIARMKQLQKEAEKEAATVIGNAKTELANCRAKYNQEFNAFSEAQNTKMVDVLVKDAEQANKELSEFQSKKVEALNKADAELKALVGSMKPKPYRPPSRPKGKNQRRKPKGVRNVRARA